MNDNDIITHLNSGHSNFNKYSKLYELDKHYPIEIHQEDIEKQYKMNIQLYPYLCNYF